MKPHHLERLYRSGIPRALPPAELEREVVSTLRAAGWTPAEISARPVAALETLLGIWNQTSETELDSYYP